VFYLSSTTGSSAAGPPTVLGAANRDAELREPDAKVRPQDAVLNSCNSSSGTGMKMERSFGAGSAVWP
jgi:hypothetical protein